MNVVTSVLTAIDDFVTDADVDSWGFFADPVKVVIGMILGAAVIGAVALIALDVFKATVGNSEKAKASGADIGRRILTLVVALSFAGLIAAVFSLFD